MHYNSPQYIISKAKQSCKKRTEKQQHITTATLSQPFPLHGIPAVKVLTCQWQVQMHHHQQAVPAVPSVHKGRAISAFSQTALRFGS